MAKVNIYWLLDRNTTYFSSIILVRVITKRSRLKIVMIKYKGSNNSSSSLIFAISYYLNFFIMFKESIGILSYSQSN